MSRTKLKVAVGLLASHTTLKVAVGLLASHTTLKAHMFKLGLTQQKDRRLFKDGKEA